MTDKDFLKKVSIAYKAYKVAVGPNLAIENFIDWLYKQYGIVKTD